MSVGDYIVVALMLATFGVLIAGIALMSIGGSANNKYANRLMMGRVGLHGMALLMLACMFMIGQA